MTAALHWMWGMTYEIDYLPSLTILDMGHDTRHRARPLNRIVFMSIGNALADQTIRGQLQNGQEAKIFITDDESDLKVVAMGQQESSN